MISSEKATVPSRYIAPYTEVSLKPGREEIGALVVITYHDRTVELNREGVVLLLRWLEKAGFEDDDEIWPGIPA